MTVQTPRSEGGASRRHVLSAGLAAAGLGAFPMLARAQGNTLRIGVVSPRSGPLALFGEGDGFVLDQVRKQLAGGIEGQVIEMWHDMDERPLRATGFGAFFGAYVADIVAGRIVYSQEYGGLVGADEVG